MFDRPLRSTAINRLSLFVAMAASAPTMTSAQVMAPINVEDACSYFGEGLTARVASFASNKEAEQTIDAIVNESGLARNFEVRAAGVPNAAAIIDGTSRYVLYNPAFMQSVRSSTNNKWAPTSIMAHEIGHHLNGHTLDGGGSRPPLELEADYFSGFILQRMGAAQSDALVAMQSLGSAAASSSHPAKADRLAAISSGWDKACDGDPSCNSEGTNGAPAKPTRKPTVVDDGPDSCDYAGDGECDEDGLCDPGTDTTDCRISPRRRDKDPISYPPTQPRGAVAQYCVTPAGSCGMAVPIPVGSICTCYTPVGVFQGISR